MRSYNVALVGNPNSGKTTLFNALTGARQRVGNWAGVTVEQRVGVFTYQQCSVHVMDLPGTYSLNLAEGEGALDESVVCHYLLSATPDLLVNVIDGNNLERNLYLTTQLIELQLPLLVVVNMLDVVQARGIVLDLPALSSELGCPVIGVTAKQARDMRALQQTIVRLAAQPSLPKAQLPYPAALQQASAALAVPISAALGEARDPAYCRALALRTLEHGAASADLGATVQAAVQQQCAQIHATLGEDPDIILADMRYGYIEKLLGRVQTRAAHKPNRGAWLDKLVLHRVLGVPIFLLIMYSMFVFAINIAGSLQDFFDLTSHTLFIDGSDYVLMHWGAPEWLRTLLARGVGTGINTTVTFLPVIGGMFVCMAFLEDSGYMARAAFVMDRLMRALGLPGKAFVPLIVGLGCNVPAVMATRTLEYKRDRLLTVMMVPFMSCGARLAIFAVFTAVFFPQGGQNIVFMLYVLGISVAIFTGLLLRNTVLSGDTAPLLLELPPYHVPSGRSVLLHAWQRLRHFLLRAGTLIVPLCVVLGVLNSVSIDGHFVAHDVDQVSLLSWLGRAVTPVFAPMGITADNWPATVGLLSGVLAKEVVIATLNTLYTQVQHIQLAQDAATFDLGAGLYAAWQSIVAHVVELKQAVLHPLLANAAPQTMHASVFGVMQRYFASKAAAIAYLLFVLLYVPCLSTTVVILRELNRGWAIFSVLWATGIAYTVAVCFYQVATWQAHPLQSVLWCVSLLGIFALVIASMRYIGAKTLAAGAAT